MGAPPPVVVFIEVEGGRHTMEQIEWRARARARVRTRARARASLRLSLKLLLAVVMVGSLLSAYTLMASAASTSSAALAGQQQASFEMKVDEAEEEISVTVYGKNLSDVYAYELQFAFDPLRMQVSQSRAQASGFTVKPVIQGKRLLFAYTKVGHAAGMSGDVKLAELGFKRLRGGDAELALTGVQLVTSELKRISTAVNEQYTVVDDSTRMQLRDIDKHWAEQRIRTAVELGFVSGYADGTFRPDQPITREEFSVLLARALQLSAATKLDFVDEQQLSSWAREGVAASVKAGLIKGYADGAFRGNRPINRAELAVMIVRGLELKPAAGTLPDFADAGQIPGWAQPSVKLAVEQGMLQGRGSNRFVPLAQATRAEAVSLLLNLLYKKAGLEV